MARWVFFIGILTFVYTLRSTLAAENISRHHSLVLTGAPLYVRASGCFSPYVVHDNKISNGGLPQGDLVGGAMPYDWGFRIGIGYCNRYVSCGVMYHRLRVTDYDALTGTTGSLWRLQGCPKSSLRWLSCGTGILGLPAIARSRQAVTWNAVDGEVDLWSWRGWCSRFHLIVGLHGMGVTCKQNIDYQGTAYIHPTVFSVNCLHHCSHRRDTWGVGPLISGVARYEGQAGLGVTFQGKGGLLAGSRRKQAKEESSVITETILPDDFALTTQSADCSLPPYRCHTVFPFYAMQLGIYYRTNYRGFRWVGEAGFLWQTYVNALPAKDHGVRQVKRCDNFSVSGIYVQLFLAI